MMPETRAAPPVSEREARRVLLELYQLEGSVAPLPGEYDDNFRVRVAGGCEYVLKVMHPARDASFVDLQCRALEHLAQAAPQLSLPRVRTLHGKPEPFSTAVLSDGAQRLVWMLEYKPGTPLADARPRSLELLRDLGRFLGELDAALVAFSHGAARRELKWDLAQAGWIRPHLGALADPARREIVERFLAWYETEVVPALPRLRRSVIHGDANDYNVLLTEPWLQPRRVASLLDFGDMHFGLTAAEPAVAAAYAVFGQNNPLRAAAAVVAGYHGAYPLLEDELAVMFPLLGMRLAVSVVLSAQRKALRPGDDYATISEAPAWDALQRLAAVHPRFAHYAFREACGLPPVPSGRRIEHHLRQASPAPLLEIDLRTAPCRVFDLSVGSGFFSPHSRKPKALPLRADVFAAMKASGVACGVGRYDEPRLLYVSPLFGASPKPTDERRTIHLGLDLFVVPGTPLHAPLDGVVYALADNAAPLDYGPVVILRHHTTAGDEFFTLFGHLSRQSLAALRVGQPVRRGEPFARVGAFEENGGWPPHVHFQIILDLLDRSTDFPGVAYASERAVWTSLSPDPNLLVGIPAERFPAEAPSVPASLAQRRALLGGNLGLSYRKPLRVARGWMQYLYDDTGRAFLDVYNNVPLVGHSHPRVVRAVAEQAAVLNTNTRYLHDTILRYARRLTGLLPDPLGVCFFLNSGSEANELALRLARTHTGNEDVVVLDHAYHGNTTSLIDVSPYKFNGPGGSGRKPWVHVAPLPDDYRGPYRRGDSEAGMKYAHHVAELLDRLHAEERRPAAFLAETLPSTAGQIVFPPGYLKETYRLIREAGGVCIADEVQTGFARLGTHFWGFETQEVVPDIVVFGKPMGNGFPLAAVVTTPQIAASFDNGMEFFSTFGGNPVSCAAGLAVLDVLAEESLQERALRVGGYLVAGLRALQGRHVLIGDVRGAGLYLGVDLVLDRATRKPAAAQASYVVNRLREEGVLTGTDGPGQNVLKLRPPLVLSEEDADLFIAALDGILAEDAARPQ